MAGLRLPKTTHLMSDRLISYAQNGEDIVLWRAFREQRRGLYVDVGANHPVSDSVTKLFYDRGWNGINVEPQPSLHAELEGARPRDVNLNVGVADHPGTLELHELPETDGLATFSPELINYYTSESRSMRVRQIPMTTLADLCRQHVHETIDFLKVDVEGFEREVLAGADWDTFRPRVVVVEETFPERWMHILDSARYTKVQFDGINAFFVREEDLGQLGDSVARPATTVLDGYDPYHYVHQLEQAAESIRQLQASNARLQSEISALTGVPVEAGQIEASLRERLRQDLRDTLRAVKRRVRP